MNGLVPKAPDPRTRLAMVRQFFDLSRLSLVAASLLAAMHVGYVWGSVPAALELAWAAAFGAQILLRASWRRAVIALDEPVLKAQQRRWEARAFWGSASTGLFWSTGLLMAFDATRPASVMFSVMISCVTVVASINVMAPQPRAFLALALPVGLTLTALLLSLPGWVSWYYAALGVAGTAMAVAIVFRHARLLYESYGLRYEREELLAQAQRAREAQTRFLAAASHDLRQPVHALGLLAAQVRAELEGRRAAATAEQLMAMASALDGLVESLLDVSRLDGGAVQVRPAPMALAPLFDRLAPEFAVLADERGLQWRLRPTELWVLSDAAQLERMLRNLLSNALRYTESGGVLLAARRRGSTVALAVWDTGPGIAPEHQARVFDEFVQLQNPGRDRSRGHGLGLAIVKRLGRLLQHPVRLRSRVGRGSCFLIELPWVAQPDPAVAPAGAGPTAGAVAGATAHPASLQPLAGLRVALVEDDDAVREATVTLLRTWGCEVRAAAVVQPLLEQAGSSGWRPQRVISDWRLVEGDGMAAIAAVREQAGEHLPALLLSGEADLPQPDALARQRIVPARKPLPAVALRAWLSAPGPPAGPG